MNKLKHTRMNLIHSLTHILTCKKQKRIQKQTWENQWFVLGLGEENKRYRLKRDALEREKEKQHDAQKHHDKTPDGFSEP